MTPAIHPRPLLVTTDDRPADHAICPIFLAHRAAEWERLAPFRTSDPDDDYFYADDQAAREGELQLLEHRGLAHTGSRRFGVTHRGFR